jgi:hypothetical protein
MGNCSSPVRMTRSPGMGYDQRIASAMRGLGYTIFPFEAYDGAGRVVLPDRLDVPARWEQAVGRVASTPAWSEVFATLSVLDDANPAWRSYMVGVGFQPGEIRVMIFKWLRSVASAQSGVQWSQSYQAVPAATIAELAGRTYAIDPGLVAALQELGSFLQQNASANATAAPDAVDGPARPLASPPPDGHEDGVAAAAVAGWALLGVQAVMAVLSAATKFGGATGVRTTVVWFPGSGDPAVTGEAAGAWTPIHTDFTTANRRTVHGIWNPAGPKYGLPPFWFSDRNAWRGLGVKDMPHTPDQVSRALRPAGVAAADEELSGAATPDAAHGDVGEAGLIQIVVAVYNAVKKVIEVGKTLIVVFKAGKWVVARLGPGVSQPPQVAYSKDYKRLLYRQPDGTYRMGNVIID